MIAAYPNPPVPPECDCTDLDGFLLNVERLMASELVALSTHEVVAAALFLWCRAWKQKPAASLPDDERVIAAFSRLPLPRFKKLRTDVMRGFVKCADGRYYHTVLAEEAMRAWDKKQAFRRKREADAERLRKWRASQDETPAETPVETRFVAEGQGRDREGKGVKSSSSDANASAAASAAPCSVASKRTQPPDRVTEAELFKFGKRVLGASAGGMIVNLRKLYPGDDMAAWDLIAQAEPKENPREWIGAVLRGDESAATPDHILFPPDVYRGVL